VPTLVVPGHDKTHDSKTGIRVGKIIPNAETHVIMPADKDVDLAVEDWVEKEGELAALCVDFMRRAEKRAA
jgi:hypothetical protein